MRLICDGLDFGDWYSAYIVWPSVLVHYQPKSINLPEDFRIPEEALDVRIEDICSGYEYFPPTEKGSLVTLSKMINSRHIASEYIQVTDFSALSLLENVNAVVVNIYELIKHCSTTNKLCESNIFFWTIL